MFKQKLIWTCVLVAVVVPAAMFADYFSNVFLFATPALVTPLNTAVIAALVSSPIGYYLIGQRFNMQRVRERLAASLAEKASAVDESQLRRQEAEGARADAELALEQLRESEALYRLLADNQTDVISLWTADGERKYTSPSLERAIGFSVEEVMAAPKLGNVHPDDAARVREMSEALTLESGARAAEFRLMHKDGSAVWVEGTFQRLSDGSGGMLTTTRIIAERKTLEQELVRALDEANVALAVKGDFLANMTHELRTPLNAIIGFSGLLQQSPALSARDARQVGLIWDASQTLLGVVNDVLDYSKLEAGAVEFDLQPFDPMQVAASTVALLAGQAAEKGLILRVSADGLEGTLLSDAARLRQVLLNFVSNAIKFTPRGEIQVLVGQTADVARRRLRVEVKDSGIGVPADQVDTIFGRFTQGDASVSRQFGGTGLGLAISKKIIEAMGGEIGVVSALGEGSTFWFEVSMPVATAASTAEDKVQAPAAVDKALRLLIVDDNAVNLELIGAVLEPFDLIIETAGDGVEAIEAVARTQFDVILMDVQMPNMDGLTATRHIRAAAAPSARRVPILAMTANVLPDQVARCLEAGMDDHVGKPINPQKLLEALARWSGADGRDRATGADADAPPPGQRTAA
jgi:PAS domain S-box-containing protein